MPGEGLERLDGHAGPGYGADAAVPETVKIRDAAGAILLRYAALSQVELEHHPRSFEWHRREYRVTRSLGGKPGSRFRQ
jgi:hypothetical protein